MRRKRLSPECSRFNYVSIFLGVVVLFTLVSAGLGQSDVIAVETNLVRVPVTVVDRDGRNVNSLGKADFRILENGVEQEISFFNVTDRPATILFLIDVSPSMLSYGKNLDEAVVALARRLNPADKVAVNSFFLFSDKILRPTLVSDLGGPVSYKMYNGADCPTTYLYNAVDDALGQLKKAPGRKAIVLFTDGWGEGYAISAKDVLKKAVESETTIYTIKFGIEPERAQWVSQKIYDKRVAKVYSFLEGIAGNTGGRSFQFERMPDVDAAFDDIAAELRHQYLLGYHPDRPGTPGERRKIKVEVSRPGIAVSSRPEVVFRGKKGS